MSDDPRFANWDPSLRSDPAQATEVNQPMYTQTQLPDQIYGGYQLGTGGMLGTPYGQNPEHPSLHQPGAPTPTQGLLAPVYPTPAYPSSSQPHAPVGTMNHTGNFGASNVGASNLNDGHAGHFLPPTSTQFNGHGADTNSAPLQTFSHAVMPPSATSTPPMTAGTSRSSSYTPETPSSNVWVPQTEAEFLAIIFKINTMLPQLTPEQADYFWLRLNAGYPMSVEELSAMIATNKANETSSSAHVAPLMRSIPASVPSINGASRSHATGTTGAQRTLKTREHRHDPRNATTPTTYQAAATSADLAYNNPKSTGATLAGGAHSSGAGGVASSRTRPANAAAGPSTAVNTAPPYVAVCNPTSPRANVPFWYNERIEVGLSPERRAALDYMYRHQDGRYCSFPGCKKPHPGHRFASAQSRNRHAQTEHIKTLEVMCSLCEHWLSREDALKVHQQSESGCKTLDKEKRKQEKMGNDKGKGKMREEPVDEDDGVVAEGPGFRKEDDDDDADLGGVSGMAAGTYGTVWA